MAHTSAAGPPVDLTENHNVEIITVVSVFCSLATLMLGTRLWAKGVSRRGLGADDIVLVAAWACTMGECIMIAYATKFGLGYHLQALTDVDQIISFQKVFFASSFVLSSALALTKISFLLLLHHLFTTPAFRLTVRILGGIVVTWWFAGIIATIFICEPINSHWDPAAQAVAKCGDQQALLLGTPIPWIVTDFAILIAPLPVLKQLQVSKPQKYGLIGLFMIGILTCIVSCVRYSTLFYPLNDPTFDVVPAAIWSVIEATVTVMTASIVASRQALSFLYPGKLISSIQSGWSSYYSGSRSGNRSGNRSGVRSAHIKLDDSTNPYSISTPLKPIVHSNTRDLSFNTKSANTSMNRDTDF